MSSLQKNFQVVNPKAYRGNSTLITLSISIFSMNLLTQNNQYNLNQYLKLNSCRNVRIELTDNFTIIPKSL